jgi:serine/threonine-protein kinase
MPASYPNLARSASGVRSGDRIDAARAILSGMRPGSPEPPEVSSILSTEGESVPTLVDAAHAPVIPPGAPHRAIPPPAPSAPSEDGTMIDPRGRPSFLDPAMLGDAGEDDFDGRYQLGEVLGRGGMGEVRLCADGRIGRTVAIKVIRPDGAKRPRLRARFLFEARMQGQLEHPSILPVYDLGVRPDGSEYFTMRRMRGRTLHEVLKALRLGERGPSVEFTRRRLLAAFQSVCLAVEFAHQRGVVHRDLKPANVMLGEFGEVIVLDWGLAKIWQRETAVTPEPSPHPGSGPLSSRASSLDTTGVGEVLGSPGYMSPEQAVDSQSVGPPSDIFALGAILFELLTFRHLIPGETNAEVTRATIAGQFEPRISKRFPDHDVPPELEAVCVQATAVDPLDRHQRARDLADAIERYLEGDRDVARRRAMAGRHTRLAIAALAESVEIRSPEGAKAARGRAIREVNHALAIDPQNQTALRTMVKIMTEAPSAVAPEAEAAIRAGDERGLRTASRRGSLAYLALAGNIALMGLLGVVSWAGLGAACGCFLGAAALTALGARARGNFAAERLIIAVIVLSSLGIAATSTLFGPLVYVPSLCAANVVVFAAGVGRRFRWIALGCGLAAILSPVLLEIAGVIPASWIFHEGVISIMPRVVRFPGTATVVLLSVASVGTVLFPALLVGAERDARTKAERELLVRSNTLAEFVPAEAGEALSVRSPPAERMSTRPPPPA